MEKYDVKFKKKFGQNFLKDVNIVKKIVRTAEIDDDSLVIEVGPGEIVDGKTVEMTVKKGDKVIVNKYSGTEIKFEGEDLIIVKQADILAIVE